MKRALLVVSFGTSHNDTRKKTLDVLLEDIRSAFPEYPVYMAWTSKKIIKKLAERDGLIIPTVTQAMESILEDGIEELVVQPTHMIKGIENDQMTQDVEAFSDRLQIRFSDPLLSDVEDYENALRGVMNEIELADDEALVLMGHGSRHQANQVYGVLDDMLKELGYMRAVMATVEAYPSMEELISHVKAMKVRRVVLAPFMMVAGDHARKDMTGDSENSWEKQFARAAFEVRCIMRGLGEYEGIRQIFVNHAKISMNQE